MQQQRRRTTRYQGAIIQNDCLLLIRFRDPVSERTFWLIPGGGLETGESEEECVKREMREETNLSVRVERLLFEDDDPEEGTYQRRSTYLCRIESGSLAPSAGYEPGPALPEGYGIIEIGWFHLGRPETWDGEVFQDAITFPLLLRIQKALGYAVSPPQSPA